MNGNEETNTEAPVEQIEQPGQSEPEKLAETIAPADLIAPANEQQDPGAITQAETINAASLLNDPGKPLPARKGKGNRKLEDYARMDWTGTNVEIAHEAGISRQRAQQLRAELKEKGYIDNDGKPLKQLPPQLSNPTISEAPADFSDIVTPESAQPLQPVKSADDYQLMADATFDMVTGGMTMIIGPEWQPRDVQGPDGKTINERVFVIEPLKKYYASKQVEDLPPGMVLAFACLVYAAPRFKEPNTKTKAKLGWQWLKVKMGSVFSRFKRRKPENITVLNNEALEKPKENED